MYRVLILPVSSSVNSSFVKYILYTDANEYESSPHILSLSLSLFHAHKHTKCVFFCETSLFFRVSKDIKT